MKKILIFILFIMILLINTPVIYADSLTTIIKGDADCNGVVDVEDALLILRILADLEDMDEKFSIRQSDLTCDYELGVDDALQILKISAKIIEQEILEHSDGIYDFMEYKDGYPVGYGIESQESISIPRLSYRLWSSNYYGKPNAYKFESNSAFWKLQWLIEDNIGTDNMELIYSEFVPVLNLPVSLTDTPMFYTFLYISPLGRKACLMYHDGIPYIYIQYTDEIEGYDGTYKYTGKIPYELSEEYLKKTYLEWRKEQYESTNQYGNKELKFDMYISSSVFSIRNAFDGANTARLVIKLKFDPLMAEVKTKDWENLKGTYKFEIRDSDVYIIDLRYDGYNISTDFDLTYSFNVLDESFTGPEVMEIKAYDLNGLEVPVSYTITN